jgi:hypothetical protein
MKKSDESIKVLTSDEYLKSKGYNENHVYFLYSDIKKMLVEFAQMHREAQQEAICEKVTAEIIHGYEGDEPYAYADRNSIRNAYTPDKIK